MQSKENYIIPFDNLNLLRKFIGDIYYNYYKIDFTSYIIEYGSVALIMTCGEFNCYGSLNRLTTTNPHLKVYPMNNYSVTHTKVWKLLNVE